MYAVIDAPPSFDLEKLGKILSVEYGYMIMPPPNSGEQNPGERMLQMIHQIMSREPDDETIALVSKEGLTLIAKEMNRKGELPLDDYRAVKAIAESLQIINPDLHFVILHRDDRIYENFCEQSPGVIRVYVDDSSFDELAAGIDRMIKERMSK
jgi:hypothetical protein